MNNRVDFLRPFLVSAILLPSVLGCTSVLSKAKDGNEAIGHYSIPKALVQLTAEVKYPQALGAGSYTLAIKGEPKVIAVPGVSIPLYYDSSVFANDNVTLELDGQTLLKQVVVDAEDQTGEVIKKLVDLAKAIAKAAAGFPASTLTVDGAGGVTREITFVLDPYAATPAAQTVGAGAAAITAQIQSAGVVPGAASAAASCQAVICYPGMRAVRVTLTGPGGPGGQLTETCSVLVPDLSTLYHVDVNRSAFVRKKVTIDFESGVLKKTVVAKPSEALAAATIPVDIVEGLVKLPTELVQLKIDTTNKQKDALNAQKALVEAQQGLMKTVKDATTGVTDSGTSNFGN